MGWCSCEYEILEWIISFSIAVNLVLLFGLIKRKKKDDTKSE